jgi:hypothetical protein
MRRADVRVVVLYEDKEQKCFLLRLAERLHLDPVRWRHCRNNVGVLQSLGEEVDALRGRNYQRNLGLVVAIDADDKGLHGRVAELLARIALDASGGPRGDAERIALVVPAWEIETWYVHLCCPEARPVDETRDYKASAEWTQLKKDIGSAAKKAVEAWPPDPDRIDPPSLSAARQELERVQ